MRPTVGEVRHKNVPFGLYGAGLESTL
jgi:hypothetical protein